MQGIRVTLILPGQIRLRVDRIKGHPEFAGEVETQLEVVPGIKNVAADPSSGAVKIRFDRKRIGQPDAIDSLKQVVGRLLPGLDLSKFEKYVKA